METIKEILMQRDGMSAEEAQAIIDEASEELQRRIADDDMEGAMGICDEYFGLEPDYLDELL